MTANAPVLNDAPPDLLTYDAPPAPAQPIPPRRVHVGDCVQSGDWPPALRPFAPLIAAAMNKTLPVRTERWRSKNGGKTGIREWDLNERVYHFADHALLFPEHADECAWELGRLQTEAAPVIAAARETARAYRLYQEAERVYNAAQQAWEDNLPVAVVL